MKKFKDLDDGDYIYIAYYKYNIIYGFKSVVIYADKKRYPGYDKILYAEPNPTRDSKYEIYTKFKTVYLPMHKMHAIKCKIKNYWFFSCEEEFKKYMTDKVNNI